MNTDTSVVSLLSNLCESKPDLRKHMEQFEASLAKYTEINEKMSQHYNPLIWRAESVSAAMAETPTEDKKKSASNLRNTLIKSMVFACKGFDCLQAKLNIPELNAMDRRGTLNAEQILETLGVLPTDVPPENGFLGFAELFEELKVLEEPMDLSKPDSA
ncbi:uncharacterized protein LOC117898980 [Drosophila subobscura]|uniref:uncharacterized protein LOC117898980 n=1 Tax=Drosophila subobscura TaxID=7241 RepID=UPI00155B0DD1|nr:uncharacterized protein LOC117898980 [Drosophila subobscura]